jgi:hypothetical protein
MISDIDWKILSLWCSKRKDTRDIANQLGLREHEVHNRLHRAIEIQRETLRLAVGM